MTHPVIQFSAGQVQVVVSYRLHGSSVTYTAQGCYLREIIHTDFQDSWTICFLPQAVSSHQRRDNVQLTLLSLVPEEGTRSLMMWHWDSNALLAVTSNLSKHRSPGSTLKRQHRQNIRYYLLLSLLLVGRLRGHQKSLGKSEIGLFLCPSFYPCFHSLDFFSSVSLGSLGSPALTGVEPRKCIWSGREDASVMPQALLRGSMWSLTDSGFILPLPHQRNRSQGKGGDGTQRKRQKHCQCPMHSHGAAQLFCFLFHQIHCIFLIPLKCMFFQTKIFRRSVVIHEIDKIHKIDAFFSILICTVKSVCSYLHLQNFWTFS